MESFSFDLILGYVFLIGCIVGLMYSVYTAVFLVKKMDETVGASYAGIDNIFLKLLRVGNYGVACSSSWAAHRLFPNKDFSLVSSLLKWQFRINILLYVFLLLIALYFV